MRDDYTVIGTCISQCPEVFVVFADDVESAWSPSSSVPAAVIAAQTAFFAHVMSLRNAVYEVPDLSRDAGMLDTPLHAGHQAIRYIAGTAITQCDNTSVGGVLCVADYVPRELTSDQKRALQALARRINQDAEYLNVSARSVGQTRSSAPHCSDARAADKEATTQGLVPATRGAATASTTRAPIEGAHASDNTSAVQQLREQLSVLTIELDQAYREFTRFTDILTHDMREPLRTIASYVELLRSRYRDQLDEDADSFIDFAIDAAERMQQRIRDLSRYAQAGTARVSIASVDLSDVLRDLIAPFSAQSQAGQINIVTTPLPSIETDRTLLSQVLQELLDNAMKFHVGGTPPSVDISVKTDNDGWRICVRDNGMGIAARHAEDVFHIFRRLNPRGRFPGQGSGLAICKRIVQRLGGSIRVEAGVAPGTTVSFTLPRAAPHTQPKKIRSSE
ncbi:MAG: hypothetical protein K0U93_17170 [Gammaproteobacteria bacterium]|nr:hypothetical protein [Gammaproteobacteria bacterium]